MGSIKQYDIDFAGSETPALDDVLKKGSVVDDGMIKFHDTTSGADTTIEAGGVEHSYSVGETHTQTNLGNGSLTMADTNDTKSASAYIGTEHISLGSYDPSTGDPINHFSMEWSEVPGVDMSDDLKEAWRTALDVKDGASIQVTTLPTADATHEGKIYQYVGETNSSLKNGYFYECIEVTPATDPKTYEWKQKNVQDGGGSGTGDASFDLDKTNNVANISNQTQHLAFTLGDDEVEVVAAEPGTYYKSKTLATKDYVDNNMPVIVGSDWGVAKEGFARIPNSSSGGATVDVDISDLNLASDDDYEVLFVGMSDSIYVLSRMTATSFTVRREAASPTASTVIRYVVFAKGYGSTPSGGTTGQVLTKKSNVDGDVEWGDGGSGGASVQVNSTGEFGQTKEGDNLISFSDNGTNVDMQMAKGSTANNLTLATKGYVDGRTGINLAVGKETWYGTYTDENDVTYQVYTKTVYIPALPATAGITTYPHDVANIKQILSIYGFTTDGFVLNAPRQNAQDNIAIYQASKSASNKTFSIEVGKDRSSKSAYVTMVYAKNN